MGCPNPPLIHDSYPYRHCYHLPLDGGLKHPRLDVDNDDGILSRCFAW
jgi:hypothetical protein